MDKENSVKKGSLTFQNHSAKNKSQVNNIKKITKPGMPQIQELAGTNIKCSGSKPSQQEGANAKNKILLMDAKPKRTRGPNTRI